MSLRAKFISLIVLSSAVMVAVSAVTLVLGRAPVELTMATSTEPLGFYSSGSAFRDVVERHKGDLRKGIGLVVKPTGGALENLKWLENNHDVHADRRLAIAYNNVLKAAFESEGALTNVRAVAQWPSGVFHLIVTSPAIQGVSDLRGGKIGFLLGPESGSYKLFEQIAGHFGLNKEEGDFEAVYRKSTDTLCTMLREGEIDAVCHTIISLKNATICNLLDTTGTRLVSVDQIDAMRITLPFLEATTIPRGTYQGSPPVPPDDVQTVSVHTTLYAHKDVPRDVIHEVVRILNEYRYELAMRDPLFVKTEFSTPPGAVNLPLHPGARDWYNQDKPGLLVTYAEVLALLLSVTILLVSGVWQIRYRLEERQKDRADMYNLQIVNLVDEARSIQDLPHLQEVREKLFGIFKKVIRDLDRDKLSADSFQLFSFPWEMAVGALRHREMMLRDTYPRTEESERGAQREQEESATGEHPEQPLAASQLKMRSEQ